MGKSSSACVHGLARVLRAEAQRLSPVAGLLLRLAPHLAANLRTFPRSSVSHSQVCLARELFYQREDALGRRFGPVAASNSKSHASYWLSVKALGRVIGLGISAAGREGKLTPKSIDQALSQVGIRCNYVDGVWSGVSLERYRRLVRTIGAEYNDSQTSNAQWESAYSLPLLLALVWERAVSKACLLEFILELENSSGQTLLLDRYADLRSSESQLRRAWLSGSFDPADLTRSRVESAMATLSLSRPAEDCQAEAERVGESCEVVVASLARERAFKPALRLGRFRHGDGPSRADCVEVVVRELLEGLIYDPERQCLRADLLPPSAPPAVKLFFSSSAPSEQAQGQRWFDLCSGLSGCLYLSSTSDGSRFELRPTMRNVCTALGTLLGCSHDCHSLDDVAEYWNSLSGRAAIAVDQRLALLRAPFSDTEKIVREVGSVRFARGDCMEIELEDAHGLATVRHSRGLGADSVWSLSSLTAAMGEQWRRSLRGGEEYAHPLTRLLRAAVLSDDMLVACGELGCADGRQLVQALLACRWGEERALGLASVLAGGARSETDGALAARLGAESEASSQRLTLLALRLLRTSPLGPLSAEAINWTLRMSSPGLAAESIAAALCRLDHALELQEQVLARPDGPLLERMVSAPSSHAPRPTRALSLRQWARLAVFRLRLAMRRIRIRMPLPF